MIPKIIHQVYGIFNDGIDFSEIPEFKHSVMKTRQFAKMYGYKYRMWSLKDCENLIIDKYSKYITLWEYFRYPIQKADFIRYCILYEFGGWYVDCDVYPIQDLHALNHKKEVFTFLNIGKLKNPYNAIMGTIPKNNLFLDIMSVCERRTYEKQNLEIYNKWKGRLVFQTTGERALAEVVPKSSIYDLLRVNNDKKNYHIDCENPYFYDNNRSYWYEEMMKSTS